MVDKKTNKNIERLSKPNEYEYYEDFVRYDPIFSEIKDGNFPYKMKLSCIKTYDYSQRMALILSAHNKYYLVDAYQTDVKNCDKIALICNEYDKLNDAIDDVEILTDGYGDHWYLVLREEENKSFNLEFEGTTFMHGDDIMDGIFCPFFEITAAVQKDPNHSFILNLEPHMYTNTNAIGFKNVEDLKDKILPLDEKIELNRKIPNQTLTKIKQLLKLER